MQQQQQQPVQAFEEVGKEFVAFYYKCMADNRAQLQGLYGDTSCMTFEGTQVRGSPAIMAKLSSLSFQKVQHGITKLDCQPVAEVSGGEGVFVTVMGQLKTDDDPPQSFVQSFLLGKAGGGSYYIANETFRLVVHDA